MCVCDIYKVVISGAPIRLCVGAWVRGCVGATNVVQPWKRVRWERVLVAFCRNWQQML